MEDKILKVPFAGRMDPDLKRKLTDEADKRNMTLSSYIELRLKEGQEVEDEIKQRISRLENLMITKPVSVYDDFEEEDYEEDEEIADKPTDEEEEALIERIEELETQNAALQAEIADLQADKKGLEDKLAAIPPLKLHFSEDEEAELEVYLQSLTENYEMTREQIVLASLYAAARNENSFLTTYSLKDFLRTDHAGRMNRFVNDKSE